MKTQHFFLLIILLISNTILSQTTYVPDNNFEQRLIDLGYDDILDDYVVTANISGITSLDIQYKNISDVTGLEDFSSLTSFNCSSNQITNLNFHPNANLNFFICQNNPITTLNLEQHTSLFEFSCSNTNITSLNLSFNNNLRYFYCSSTLLTELNLSNNSNLLEIYASNNIFENVDIRNGNNTGISEFIFNNNPNLTYIIVDDCNYSSTNWTNIDATTIFIEEIGQTSCNLLGIEDLTSNFDISIYPNPNNGIIYLNNTNNEKIKNMYITDISGKKIKDLMNFHKINLLNMKSGIYFLKIQTYSSIISIKVIKI